MTCTKSSNTACLLCTHKWQLHVFSTWQILSKLENQTLFLKGIKSHINTIMYSLSAKNKTAIVFGIKLKKMNEGWGDDSVIFCHASMKSWCQMHVKNGHGKCKLVILVLGRYRQVDSWDHQSASVATNQWRTLFQKTRWWLLNNGRQGCLLASICMHRHKQMQKRKWFTSIILLTTPPAGRYTKLVGH